MTRTGQSQPIAIADPRFDIERQVECECCAHHLANAPEYDWIWSDVTGQWEPYCGCPRHHLGARAEAAAWLFVRHDHQLVGGCPVKVRTVSWPVCDPCMRSWVGDGLHPDEGHVLRL